MDVEYANPEKNLDNLVGLCRRAASRGAKIICAPEMCLSGYVHKTIGSIWDLAESSSGRAAEAISQTALETETFIVAGWAEKAAQRSVLYNSAFVFAPNGTLVCRYRKVNAETRWAAPGHASQYNIFMTPWGAVGLLICADSYHSLIPRITALKGASLICLPSNWPDSDGFPELLWQQRAWENGIWLAAVNRSGRENEIDFSSARTMAFDPDGSLVPLWSDPEDERVKILDISLNSKGLFDDRRNQRLESRQPEFYHRVYGNLAAVRDLTSCLNLPQPGWLDFHALSPGQNDCLDFLTANFSNFRAGSLVLIPLGSYGTDNLERLSQMAHSSKLTIVGADLAGGETQYFALGPNVKAVPTNLGQSLAADTGPARVLLTSLKAMSHPEAALAAAKEGVDLVLCPAQILDESDLRLIALRPIEQLAAAACSLNCSTVSLIPLGHGQGRGATVGAGQVLTYVVDTRQTRDKRFQDRVDFETLFGPRANKLVWSNDDL
jgi:predicted amidohydrolase